MFSAGKVYIFIYLPLVALLIQGLFSSARGAEPVFLLFRYQASPWRCGAGFNFDMSLRARCPLFFSREKRAGGALRGGAGRGSTRRCCCELDVPFFYGFLLGSSGLPVTF